MEQMPEDQDHRYPRSFELYNGTSIPSVGLGTWQMTAEHDVRNSVRACLLQFGYRHIDTASIYRNEHFIGSELKEISKQVAPLAPNSIFLTSKVPPTCTKSYDGVMECFERSCRDLGTDCIDLYLIHWPGTSKIDVKSPQNAQLRLQTWYALERLYRDKRVKAIGVSNFMPHHLIGSSGRRGGGSGVGGDETTTNSSFLDQVSIVPMFNSIEYHPLIGLCDSYRQLEQICREHRIVMQSYTSMAQGHLLDEQMEHFSKLSHGLRTSDKTLLSQKILQWSLHHDKCVIPKSTNMKHLKSNIDILGMSKLSAEEVTVMDELYCDKRICWDPTQTA